MKLNTGLAHRECHDIADKEPGQMIYLPRFFEVQYVGWLIDPQWHEEQKLLYDGIITFPDFQDISNQRNLHLENITHHGDLLILM